MIRIREIALTFLFTVSIFPAFAQFRVKNHHSLAGRRETPVNCVSQTPDGHLLVGGTDGFFIFDGKSSVNQGNTFRQLRQNITAVHNAGNRYFIGTSTGKVYMLSHNRIDSLTLPGIDAARITAFLPTSSGMLIGTYGSGLYLSTGRQVVHYKDSSGLSDNVIYNMRGHEDRIWCCTDGGITEISIAQAKPQFTVIATEHGIPDLIVRNVSIDKDRLLIAMQDSGVCFMDLRTRKVTRPSWSRGWNKGPVINAEVFGRDKLVIATEREGLVYIDKGNTTIFDYLKHAQVVSISQMFIDREKQIWLTGRKGLSQLSEKRYYLIDSLSGLKHPNILALVRTRNEIWSGGSEGISRVVISSKGISVIPVAGTERFSVSCAAVAPGGDVWFGTYGKGILIVNPRTMKFVTINSREDSLVNDNISNIHFANDTTVYFSTLGSGIFRVYIKNKGELSYFNRDRVFTERDGLGSNYVYASTTDRQGRLYVATDGGGLQVLKNRSFVPLIRKFGLRSTTAFALCRDRQNRVWATTNADGIVLFDGRSLRSFGQEEGLRDLEPQQIVAAGNAVYAIHARGIDRIDCSTFDVTYYDVLEPGIEPNLNAIHTDQANLYCGTNRGAIVFRFEKNAGDSTRPTVFIHSLLMNTQRIPLDSLTEFTHSQNNLSFGFSGIWLKNPDKLTFRYRLDGLEDRWSYADEGKVINYNNLEPGKYTFIVQSRNEEDVWSEAVQYRFTMLTPLWQRWWFWAVVVVGTVVAFYLFVQFRLQRLRRKNQVLEERVMLRTREIAQQARVIEKKNKELEQLSLVASKTDNVVLILDADGNLEYINESFVRLTGLTLEEVKKQYGQTIYELSNHPNIRQIIDDAVSNHRSVTYETMNNKVDSRVMWDSSTLTPIYDEKDELRKIVIIDTDVTDRKRQEQIIIQKNKDITDSISYARKIQHAILPSDALIVEHLPESFVLYMTKDIVSGDFYWFSHMYDFSIIAAVDCTGHGVPGAFMSLIGYNLLNRIINENKIFDPSRILLELNNGVLGVLHKNESESKDGMDIAICKINHNAQTIEYAGAMRPLWIVSNGKLREIKADKIPIGTKQKDREEQIGYTTHMIPVNNGDRLYIFTDGYADQFGGERDKKFSTARFKELLIANAPLDFKTQEENIRRAHLEWKGDNEQIDDILVIGFGITRKLIG